MIQQTIFDVQPANEADEPKLDEQKETVEQKVAREREELLSRLSEYKLDAVRTRVAYVLNQHPICRNSDIELAIHYWRLFHREDAGAEGISYEALRKITPMTSIVRARAHVQNRFRLFLADEPVEESRDERQGKVRRKARAEATQVAPLVHVYADESGKTDPHFVIGSMWINNADDQMLRLARRLQQWRKSIQSGSELKFVNIKPHSKANYIEFVRQALAESEYVGFKAIILAKAEVRHRPTEDAIFNLYYRLIVDGVEHELKRGRFSKPRGIVLKKDEDESTDKIHLKNLRDRLQVECPKRFDNEIYVADAVSLNSTRDILIIPFGTSIVLGGRWAGSGLEWEVGWITALAQGLDGAG